MQDYIASKFSIAKNMDLSDYLVINIDDNFLNSARHNFSHTNVITISTKSKDADIYYFDGKICDVEMKQFLDFSAPKTLQGEHNIYNALIAYAISTKLGVDPQQAVLRLQSFQGLKHRNQFVGEKDLISFYNDSKATNAQATSNALKAFDNIFWLAGGLAKAGGISSILHLMGNVEKAYFFGQAAKDFAQQAQVSSFVCETMQEAFVQCYNDARNFGLPCNVLLSPACASFDQYKNFEERGEEFIKLVKKVI
jgi:UDP-N-acetylmuramoylalanine--D-glutamate ligase